MLPTLLYNYHAEVFRFGISHRGKNVTKQVSRYELIPFFLEKKKRRKKNGDEYFVYVFSTLGYCVSVYALGANILIKIGK